MSAERLGTQLKGGLDAPICLTWELTYACNLACVHCLSSSGRRDPRELTTAEAKQVIDAWGFTYVQDYVWGKVQKDAELKIREDKDLRVTNLTKMGMGRTFRKCHETALICVRGKPGKFRLNKAQRSLHLEPLQGATRKQHSSKPETLQDALELMFPAFKRRLELFARRVRPGWECLGNEIDGLDIRDAINKLRGRPYNPAPPSRISRMSTLLSMMPDEGIITL